MQTIAQIPHALEVLRIGMNDRFYYSLPHVGDYKFSARTSDFNGWLLCDGREVNVADYQGLYDVIGNSFGGGEGTFNLPNCQARVPGAVGVFGGSNFTMGDAVGATTHTLTVQQMPSHNHTINDPGHIHTGDTYRTGNQSTDNAFGTETAANETTAEGTVDSATTGITINNTGGGLPHNNMQPTLFVGNMFIFAGFFDIAKDEIAVGGN